MPTTVKLSRAKAEKAKRRVAIAKDALKQLTAGKIQAVAGWYLNLRTKNPVKESSFQNCCDPAKSNHAKSAPSEPASSATSGSTTQ